MDEIDREAARIALDAADCFRCKDDLIVKEFQDTAKEMLREIRRKALTEVAAELKNMYGEMDPGAVGWGYLEGFHAAMCELNRRIAYTEIATPDDVVREALVSDVEPKLSAERDTRE